MLNPDLVGRTFTSADSVTVTKEAIQKFAEVIGESNI
jgi:acyl dehydratase